MNDIITLYHGSIADFDEVDIKKGKPYKDFGQGFYCSETYGQAFGMATRNYDIELAKILFRRLWAGRYRQDNGDTVGSSNAGELTSANLFRHQTRC